MREPLPAHGGQWSLVCDRDDAVLEPVFVRATRDLFEAVAAGRGGEHDGWEAAVSGWGFRRGRGGSAAVGRPGVREEACRLRGGRAVPARRGL